MRRRKGFSLLLSFLGIGLLVTSCSLGQPQTRSNSAGGSPDHQSAAQPPLESLAAELRSNRQLCEQPKSELGV